MCYSLGVRLRAGMSTLQQAAAFGYPSTVYMIRPKDTFQKLPPWAWLMVALGALGILIAGELLPQGSKRAGFPLIRHQSMLCVRHLPSFEI